MTERGRTKLGNAPEVMLATPLEWWLQLDKEFNFEVDLAASDEWHLCETYYTKDNDAFLHPWDKTSWCSPPWTEPELTAFVYRAAKDSQLYNSTIVMLLPVREEAPWWKRFVDEVDLRYIDPPLAFVPMSDPQGPLWVEDHCIWIFDYRDKMGG